MMQEKFVIHQARLDKFCTFKKPNVRNESVATSGDSVRNVDAIVNPWWLQTPSDVLPGYLNIAHIDDVRKIMETTVGDNEYTRCIAIANRAIQTRDDNGEYAINLLYRKMLISMTVVRRNICSKL